MILFTLLVTLIYFLPGEDSFYSAPYEYSRGSSKSCSGAFVDDPDLQKQYLFATHTVTIRMVM